MNYYSLYAAPHIFQSFPSRRSSDMGGEAILLPARGQPPPVQPFEAPRDLAVDHLEQAFEARTVERGAQDRSEEHTSELQSGQYLVSRRLLEKKNIVHVR